LDCGSPLPLFNEWRDPQSGRELPQSKTLRAIQWSWDFGAAEYLNPALPKNPVVS